MAALVLQLTDAGLAAVQAPSGSDPTVISEIGLTNRPFDFAPTLEALPGQFKRVEVTSGTAAAPNVAHLTAYDTSDDIWAATGFGLFLEDGTLFAAYSSADTIISKAEVAFALLVFDIAFNNDFAANIAFGNALFINPPATEEMRGILRIAKAAEVAAGASDDSAVTPLKLKAQLDPIRTGLANETQARQQADTGFADAIAAIVGRLNSGEFSKAITGNLVDKGHVDFPIGEARLRFNWGKKDVAAKTATTDTFDAQYSICFGVFQGGGTNDPTNTDAIRAYPGAGPQSLTLVNLTNGTAGLLTIHWIAIGLAA